MPVHHATVKSAAKFGIILSGDIETATAKHAATGVTVEAIDGKFALAACRIAARLKAEYPMLEASFDEDAMEGEILHDGETLTTFPMDEPVDVDGIITDALEAAQEAEISLEGEADDDEEARGNVVPEKYKIEYTARGNRDHCGDWIALQLDGKFRMLDPVGKGDIFDHVAFLAFLETNGTDLTGKWVDLPSTDQPGWVGRFRMNGRQKLEKRLARTGVMQLNGKSLTLPSSYLAELVRKHPEPKAKVVKAEAPKPEAPVKAARKPRAKK